MRGALLARRAPAKAVQRLGPLAIDGFSARTRQRIRQVGDQRTVRFGAATSLRAGIRFWRRDDGLTWHPTAHIVPVNRTPATCRPTFVPLVLSDQGSGGGVYHHRAVRRDGSVPSFPGKYDPFDGDFFTGPAMLLSARCSRARRNTAALAPCKHGGLRAAALAPATSAPLAARPGSNRSIPLVPHRGGPPDTSSKAEPPLTCAGSGKFTRPSNSGAASDRPTSVGRGVPEVEVPRGWPARGDGALGDETVSMSGRGEIRGNRWRRSVAGVWARASHARRSLGRGIPRGRCISHVDRLGWRPRTSIRAIDVCPPGGGLEEVDGDAGLFGEARGKLFDQAGRAGGVDGDIGEGAGGGKQAGGWRR